jgi:hypothetical protein
MKTGLFWVLEFVLFFFADGRRPSASAVLRCETIEQALQKTAEMAKFDGRQIEIWRDQKLLGRFRAARGDHDVDRKEEF